MKFKIVVADPPYNFSDKLEMSEVKRGAQANYDTLSVEDLKNLPVKDICEEDSLLALWCPSSLLSSGLEIMLSWGFRQTQTHIWIKTKKRENLPGALFDEFGYSDDLDHNSLYFGMGRLFRQTHEIVLVGVRGKIYNYLENRSQRSVHFYPATKHSKKPEALQDMLDIMFPPPEDGSVNRLELFARRERKGWICIGNEVSSTFGEDIRDSIKSITPP